MFAYQYADWEILQFKSYVFKDEHPNVQKHLHASNKIVARKVRIELLMGEELDFPVYKKNFLSYNVT